MRLKNIYLSLSVVFFIHSIGQAQSSAAFGGAKFAPEESKKLLIIGQDLGSVGGLTDYSEGYIDYVGELMPAGVTSYTSIESLSGLTQTANWGAGDVNADLYLNDPSFSNSFLVIGLYLVGILDEINSGLHDENILSFARWVKEQEVPIFIRIGYEFEGPWNNYDPADFKSAWRYIVHKFDEEKVRNASFVWQSAGLNYPNILQWYPGDEYVNWFGYSQFDGFNMGQSIKQLALQKDKPIMIAEATPKLVLSNMQGQQNWNVWFQRVFDEIYENDRIKAFCYINANWDAQSMWVGQGWGDSRVEADPFIKEKWEVEIEKEPWIHGTDELLEQLNFTDWLELSTAINENEIVQNNELKIQSSLDGTKIYLNDHSFFHEIRVTSLDGKEERKVTNLNTTSYTFHPNDLNTGIYIITVIPKDSSMKFSKLHFSLSN